MGNDKKFTSYLKDELESPKTDLDKKAVIYKYFNEEEKAQRLFQQLVPMGYRLYSSRYGDQGEKDKNKPDALVETASIQISVGIWNFFGGNPERAHQLFAWAELNTELPPDYVRGMIGVKGYHEVAVGYLWHGYAQVCLGRFGEALPFLTQVIPLFVQTRKMGVEVWQKTEYALPKALVPLCEFKLDPTAEHLTAAQQGIEAYLKSLKMYRDRLTGLLYYHHLKAQFPEVYGADPASFVPPSASDAGKPATAFEPPSGREKDPEGEIVMSLIRPDPPELYGMEWFGPYAAFEAFVANVRSLGGYPALEALMDTYALEDRQQAAPVLNDCERLLGRRDLGPEVRTYAETILSLMRTAVRDDGSMREDTLVEIIHETGA